ncbi:hypothetical protein VOLCADRAFT_103560 [Volvox carteri f. nagariensis]|uniref:peptidylprolyl isomerase n=1 Tax=Volvox carteri f. nagariensis TaxID=3068 RepID=D8TMT3_VOLCA|nr:uncharacterized protein VOLCADRAFT_103560 [Volvox carteri f. nagariensis]EFJ51308.1 hypothetical protein VOLCADRAFT_103560 [Volvox carteri f. nagariensis]|eukprot:XP_002947775.1 hypothetical protein VOLCADRAFT_103560 [Volvox carteri f. nagariensis]
MADDKVMSSVSADEGMEETNADLAPLQTNEALGEPYNNGGMDDDFDYGDEVGKEVPLTDDGGLIKKIITAGESWETPEAGDEVTVHYVGTLEDGSKFDSSRDRDEPFVFTLGQGRVIKGWDLGVAKMKKGETALLICKPEYAYGAQGSPPKIPPNATLHFEVELLSWRSVKDIAGDGGVIKTVLTEGSGWATCEDQFEAKVSYTARVSGSETPFATSDDTLFTVSEGHLIPAVRVALKTMKKGEKVALKVKPAYGFGEAGSEQYGVPPNADLEVEHLTPGGGVVMKTLLSNDKEFRKPNEGAKVTVRLVGEVLPNGPVFVRHEEGSELVFTTGEEQVCEGLEAAVMKMKEGDKALVTINDPAQGYGFETEYAGPLAVVPPGSALQFDVELVQFENSKESWEMNDQEKVEAARQRKEKGNFYFKAGKVFKAKSLWERAVSLVQYDKSFPDDAKQASRDIKRSCWLNMAAIDVKQAHWKDALKHCSSVLEIDSQNVKALYRRAQAQMGLQDLFEAEQDLKKALDLEPNNADVLALMRKLKVAVREQNKKEASMYSKMFKFPAKASKAAPAAEGGHTPMVVADQPVAPAAATVEATGEDAAVPAAESVTVVPAEAEMATA